MARRGTSGATKSQQENQPQAMSAAIGSASQQDRGNGHAARSSGGDGRASQTPMNFSSEEIAQRAYQIYERDGRADGKDMDHWLQAERELREEREGASSVQAQEAGRSQEPRAGSGGQNRPQRPDEAPRSARRQQPSMV